MYNKGHRELCESLQGLGTGKLAEDQSHLHCILPTTSKLLRRQLYQGSEIRARGTCGRELCDPCCSDIPAGRRRSLEKQGKRGLFG